jgi:8-oxo-dGTP diphosphatase
MGKIITPLLTVDIIIELVDEPENPIVLIERKNPPYGWALPGGFVDLGETLEHAAVREAKEETCLDVTLSFLLGAYSDPKRDNRGHTVSLVYVAQAHGQPMAADDAKNVKIFPPSKIDVDLVFDHALIIADYIEFLRTQKPAQLR